MLRYAGSIFPGVAALVAEVTAKRDALIWIDGEEAELMVEMIGDVDQAEWRRQIAMVRVADPNLKYAAASAKALIDAWHDLLAALSGEDEDEDERAAFARAGAVA